MPPAPTISKLYHQELALFLVQILPNISKPVLQIHALPLLLQQNVNHIFIQKEQTAMLTMPLQTLNVDLAIRAIHYQVQPALPAKLQNHAPNVVKASF